MKQGTCIMVDDQPTPPAGAFAAHKGWKEVKGFKAVKGGADFLFPADQILKIGKKGQYLEFKKGVNTRKLGSLDSTQHYLVWYHHLLQIDTWKKKSGAQ